MSDTTDHSTYTEIGTTALYTGEFTLDELLANYLNDADHDYDMDALRAAYRTRVENRMPDGVWLNGDTVHTAWDNRDDVSHEAISEAFEIPEEELAELLSEHQVAYEQMTGSRYTRTVELPDGRSVVYTRTGLDDVVSYRRRILDNGGGIVHEAIIDRDDDGDWVLRTRLHTEAKFHLVYLEDGEEDEFEREWRYMTLAGALDDAEHPGVRTAEILRANR